MRRSFDEAGKTRREVRFHISSLRAEAEVMAAEDSAPANFATIKHMTSNTLRSSKSTQSIRRKRHAAAWDGDFLFDFITA